jgi:hypothetical protein
MTRCYLIVKIKVTYCKVTDMNKLDREARACILRLLCEGASIRAITRMTGASKNTVIKLVVDAGKAASWYQDRVFRNLTCKRLQVDEIWNFVYAKQKNVPNAKAAPSNAGDVWTWTAIDADTKIMPSWFVGGRDSDSAIIFMDDLASRLANRVQLTSDGHRAYLEAVEGAFGAHIDYAPLVKIYGTPPEGEKRYSPAECIGMVKTRIEGNPDPNPRLTHFEFSRLPRGVSRICFSVINQLGIALRRAPPRIR